MSRTSVRNLSSVLGAASLVVTVLLVPGTPAYAAETAVGTLTVAPTEGAPGAVLSATVTIDTEACTVTEGSVKINGTYIDADGQDATTDEVTAVPGTTAGTYTASLTVPADAARSDLTDEPLAYEASAVCVTQTQPAAKRAAAQAAVPAGATSAGTANVTVLALTGEPVVTVDPDTVKPGDSFAFTITGCTGGLADLFFLDGDGNDTDVPDANVTQTSATAYNGTFTVPTSAVLGDGGIIVDCSQADSTGAGVRIIGDANEGDGSGAPIAVPVIDTPRFTG